MVFVTNSKRLWLVGTAISLLIFGVLYLTVIRPDQSTANHLARQSEQAIGAGLKQSQQAINQAQKQLSSTGGAAGATANQALSKAAKLTACISAAGTNTTKLQACQAQFGP
jgi:hypothetical protein